MFEGYIAVAKAMGLDWKQEEKNLAESLWFEKNLRWYAFCKDTHLQSPYPKLLPYLLPKLL